MRAKPMGNIIFKSLTILSVLVIGTGFLFFMILFPIQFHWLRSENSRLINQSNLEMNGFYLDVETIRSTPAFFFGSQHSKTIRKRVVPVDKNGHFKIPGKFAVTSRFWIFSDKNIVYNQIQLHHRSSSDINISLWLIPHSNNHRKVYLIGTEKLAIQFEPNFASLIKEALNQKGIIVSNPVFSVEYDLLMPGESRGVSDRSFCFDISPEQMDSVRIFKQGNLVLFPLKSALEQNVFVSLRDEKNGLYRQIMACQVYRASVKGEHAFNELHIRVKLADIYSHMFDLILMDAIYTENAILLNKLLLSGVDPNCENALTHAVINCKPQIVKALLDAGADPNRYRVKLLSGPQNDPSLLSYAKMINRQEIADLLLKYGAKPMGMEKPDSTAQ
jgi:hypothetical protein